MIILKVLADDEKRKTYDRHGEEGLKNMHNGGGDPFDPFSRYAAVDSVKIGYV